MNRELQWADIEAAYQHVATRAVETICHGQELLPAALLIWLAETRPGAVERCEAFPPEITLWAFRSSAGKARLGVLIRECLAPAPAGETLPYVIVVVSEAWTVKSVPGETRPFAERPFAERPDRRDVLMVAVHTTLSTHMGASPIETSADGARHCTLQPLDSDARISGRLSMDPDGGPGRCKDH